MNSKIAVICVAVLLVICLSEVDGKKEKGKGKGKGKGHHHSCLGTEMKFDDDDKTAWKDCMGKKEEKTEDVSEESGESKKKWGKNKCMMHCIFKKKSLITDDGKLDATKIEAAIKKVYPEDAQKGLIAAQKECAKKVTETITDDDDCESFQDYVKCYFGAVKKNCHVEKKKDEESEDE